VPRLWNRIIISLSDITRPKRESVLKRMRSQKPHRKKAESEQRTVVVLAGMPGAGKSLASTVAKQSGIPVLVSGDVVRLEAKKRGLEPTRSNLGRLMLEIRKKEGMGAVARRLLPLIDQTTAPVVVYEGARNMEEIDELKKHYTVSSVAVHASPRSRYQRLLRRKRQDQPNNWKQFLERDNRELKVGIGRVISLSDRMIENEETKDQLKKQTRRVLKKIRE
jgi:dephospho-CoA kinase